MKELYTKSTPRFLVGACLWIAAGLFAFSLFAIAHYKPFVDLRSVRRGAIVLVAIGFLLLAMKRVRAIRLSAVVILPLIIVAAGRGQGLLASVLYIAASVTLGLPLYCWFFRSAKAEGTTLVNSLFLGLSINAFLIWTALHFPINFPYIYYMVFIAELLAFGPKALNFYGAFPKSEWHLSLGQYAVFGAGIFYLFYALIPGYLWDDLIVHLYLPKFVLQNGFMDFDPRFVMGLDSSIIPRASYVAVFVMGGEYAIRLLHLGLFLAAIFLVERFVREHFNARAALFSILIMVTMPFLLYQLGIVFIDSFQLLGAVVLSAYVFTHSSQNSGRLIFLYFILAAFAYLSKQQSIFIIIPATLLLLAASAAKWIRDRSFSTFPHFAGGSILCMGIVSVVLIHNYVLSGNPIFPFYNGIFKSEWYWPENFVDGRWQQPLNWQSLYDLTFHGSRYIENIDVAFGFSFFVMAPLLLLLVWHPNKRKLLGIAFCFLIACVIWFELTGPYMRYFITCLPLGAILLAAAVDSLLGTSKEIPWLKYPAVVLIAGIFLLNWVCLMSIVNVPKPYPVLEAITGNYRRNSIAYDIEMKRIFDYANAKYGKNSKVLLVGNIPYLYFTDSKVETVMWYHARTRIELMEKTKSAEQLFDAIFKQRKFDYIIMPETSTPEYARFYSPEFQILLKHEFSIRDLALYVPAK